MMRGPRVFYHQRMKACMLVFAAALCSPAAFAQFYPMQQVDAPHNFKNPARMDAFQLPSHGEKLNALVYVAAGETPHPTVVLLHGFPGNEKNLDLAQAIRRQGWNVLYFDYRGSWGSPGAFSFTNAIEDAQAAVEYLRDPEHAGRLNSDPKNIVLIGHSMGGMIALVAGANDPSILAVEAISAADMAGRALPAVRAGKSELAVAPMAKALAEQGMAPLAGCTPESLARDAIAHAEAWSLVAQAEKLKSRPVLVVTSDDGLRAIDDALVAKLKAAGDTRATSFHFTTDHSYSDARLLLTGATLEWLQAIGMAKLKNVNP